MYCHSSTFPRRTRDSRRICHTVQVFLQLIVFTAGLVPWSQPLCHKGLHLSIILIFVPASQILLHRWKQVIITRTLSRLKKSLSFFGVLVKELIRHGNVFYRQPKYMFNIPLLFFGNNLETQCFLNSQCVLTRSKEFYTFSPKECSLPCSQHPFILSCINPVYLL